MRREQDEERWRRGTLQGHTTHPQPYEQLLMGWWVGRMTAGGGDKRGERERRGSGDDDRGWGMGDTR